jgi:hypothetical protein
VKDAKAGFVCGGVLTDAQRAGFQTMFAPAYSPNLSHTGGAVAPANMSKKLSSTALKRLQTTEPVVAASHRLSASHATLLKGWLNDNAIATLPGWISTVIGVVAPAAWIGLAADVSLQLVNANGDTGRLKVANLAGTVSEGGEIGIFEQVAKDSQGKLKFLFTHVYVYELNGKRLMSPLSICSADVVVI